MWIFLKILWHALWNRLQNVIPKLTFFTSRWEWSFTPLRPTPIVIKTFVAWHIVTFLKQYPNWFLGNCYLLLLVHVVVAVTQAGWNQWVSAHVQLAATTWWEPKPGNRLAYTPRNKTWISFLLLDLNYGRIRRGEHLALFCYYVEQKQHPGTEQMYEESLYFDKISRALHPVLLEARYHRLFGVWTNTFRLYSSHFELGCFWFWFLFVCLLFYRLQPESLP